MDPPLFERKSIIKDKEMFFGHITHPRPLEFMCSESDINRFMSAEGLMANSVVVRMHHDEKPEVYDIIYELQDRYRFTSMRKLGFFSPLPETSHLIVYSDEQYRSICENLAERYRTHKVHIARNVTFQTHIGDTFARFAFVSPSFAAFLDDPDHSEEIDRLANHLIGVELSLLIAPDLRTPLKSDPRHIDMTLLTAVAQYWKDPIAYWERM